MLVLAMALSQATIPTAATMELICTVPVNAVTFRFTINEDAKSFTGKSGDQPLAGTAYVDDERISLTSPGSKITWHYEINRLTGDFQMSGALNGQSDRHAETRGRCQKFTGAVL